MDKSETWGGDNLFTTKDNAPSSYNTQADNVQQEQSGDNNIGNIVARQQAAAAPEEEEEEPE